MQPGLEGLAQYAYIPVLNVPAVLAQMNYYAVRTGDLGYVRGGDRVRFPAQSGLTQCGYMIDIDYEYGHFVLQILESPQFSSPIVKSQGKQELGMENSALKPVRPEGQIRLPYFCFFPILSFVDLRA